MFPLPPRCSLGFFPTPLEVLPRLSQRLQGPTLWIKRDDQTGLACGGNKTRKLEFLLAEAIATGADTVITAGASQSNHCRQTAAAAAKLGLACHLLLGGQEPDEVTGNLLLDQWLGAKIHWSGNQRKGEQLKSLAFQLQQEGRHPYVVPYGGSNALGAQGFVTAIAELKQQLQDHNLRLDAIVVASSSGGTQAGMTVGLKQFGLSCQLIGISIDKLEGDRPYETLLAELATAAGEGLRFEPSDFTVNRDYLGQGYGVVGSLEREAIALLAQTEGILLDPVYTARAFGGLIDLIRQGHFKPTDQVLFWHTGGIPALLAKG